MLEGLPPNNAAHKLRLVCDEKRARAVADLIVESFEPAEAASTAFETEEPWPGGGKAWLVEAYFGFAPDEEALRDLVAVAAGRRRRRGRRIRPHGKARLGRQCARRTDAGARRALSRPRRARPRARRANDVGVEIEAGLAFGTGHHGTTRGCLLHFDRLLKRRRPRTSLDVGCGAGVLAIAAAKVLRRKVWLGDIDPVAVEVANANARLNGVGAYCKAIVSRGVENLLLREGAPYDLVFANILAKPLRLLAPSLAAVTAPDGEAIVSGLLLSDVPGVLAAWRAQGFYLGRADRPRGLGEPAAEAVRGARASLERPDRDPLEVGLAAARRTGRRSFRSKTARRSASATNGPRATPIFFFSRRTKSTGEGISRQTLGRNRPTARPSRSSRPSRSGLSWSINSCFAAAGDRRRRRKHGNLDRQIRQFGARQRRETWIAEPGPDRVGADVAGQRPLRDERTDAAAQRPAALQRREGGAMRRQAGRQFRVGDDLGRRPAAGRGEVQRRRGDGDETILVGLREPRRARIFEREGAVADDALPRAAHLVGRWRRRTPSRACAGFVRGGSRPSGWRSRRRCRGRVRSSGRPRSGRGSRRPWRAPPRAGRKCERSEEMQIAVSGPPHRRRRTSSTSSGAASPTSTGAISSPGIRRCRKISSISRLCSRSNGRASTATPSSGRIASSAPPATGATPSGVDHAEAG